MTDKANGSGRSSGTKDRLARALATRLRYSGPLARARRIFLGFKLHSLGYDDDEIAEVLGISDRQVRFDRTAFVRDASGRNADLEYRLEAREALDEAVRVAHILALAPDADSRDARALAYAARQKALASGEIPVAANSTVISGDRLSVIPPGMTDEDLDRLIDAAEKAQRPEIEGAGEGS
jgi:hypothetical protein